MPYEATAEVIDLDAFRARRARRARPAATPGFLLVWTWWVAVIPLR